MDKTIKSDLLKEFFKIQIWPVLKTKWLFLVFYPITVLESFLSPYFFGAVVGALTSNTANWALMETLLLQWLGVSAIILVLSDRLYIIVDGITHDVCRKIRSTITEVLFNFDVKKFLDHRPGEIFTKLDKVENSANDLILQVAFTYINATIFLLLSAFYIFSLSFWMGILFCGGQLLFMTFMMIRNKFFREQQNKLNQRHSEISGDLQDKTANLLIVKNQAREGWEMARFGNDYGEYYEADMKQSAGWRISRTILDMCQVVLIVSAGWVGYYAISTGSLAVDTLVTCLWLFQRGSNNMRGMVQSWKFVIRAIVAITDGQEILRQEVLVKDIENAKKLQIKEGQIEFKNVVFDYDNKPAISGIDLVIPAGKTTAFVGHSGAGKSTLAALLMRYYDLKSGEILIDGQNISKVTQASLRAKLAFVMQDNSLFHESIRFNIAYGKEKASQKQVEEASKKAQIHDFIVGLEKGYDTKVGQRGLRLSGGERQRISIARAILKNAPIMILDEATSALDSVNEGKVQKALLELMRDKTSVVIAHRLSTIKKADLIVVLKCGKIVEQGTHDQLMKKAKGHYATLVKEQVNGMIV